MNIRKSIAARISQHPTFFRFIPDRIYLKIMYRGLLNRKLSLKNPMAYTEKLQWLKLYDRKPQYVAMADKYEAKKIVANIVGDEYVVPTIGIWNSWHEIDFSALPERFVLKTTHDSGGVVVVQNKKEMNQKKAEKKINKSLRNNFYYKYREWVYKDIKPRIIAEQYLEDNKTKELRDYKFFVFNGECKIMFVASERQNICEETKFDFFDMDYNWLPIKNGHPNSTTPPAKPTHFELMKSLSEKIGNGFPHIRVDFYEVNGKVYVGELTFYHWSGLIPFKPDEWDYKIGEWLELPTPNY